MRLISESEYREIISLCHRIEKLDPNTVRTAELRRRAMVLKRKLTSQKTKNMTLEEFDMTRNFIKNNIKTKENDDIER